MIKNYRVEAEKHLATAAHHLTELPSDMRIAEVAAAIGQGYATLAAAANKPLARASDAIASQAASSSYRQILVGHIASLLEHGTDEQHDSAVGLAKQLDQAGLNLDDDVDDRIARYGEINPSDAWKPPSVRRAEWEAAHPCPW